AGSAGPVPPPSVQLRQTGLARPLARFAPTRVDETEIAEYNRLSTLSWERIRDFIVRHCHATGRDDSPLWNYCRTMSIPSTLQRKIDLFKASGRFFREDDELFVDSNWVAVFLGQKVWPRRYDPLVDGLDMRGVRHNCERLRALIRKTAEAMPSQRAFIERYCAANPT